MVGCGDIAVSRHIPALLANKDVDLVAICDTDGERAAAAAERYGIRAHTTDYRKLMRDGSVDAAIVATPPWVTPDITIDLLRAGKHVLCEKPMAILPEKAEEVARTERETGKKVQVGFTYRHDPLLEQLRDWIREGRLGSPRYFRIGIFDEVWDPVGNPEHYRRIFKTMEYGVPSVHDGAHIADFLHMLTDSPVKQVHAFGYKSRSEFPASNFDTSIIDFANGDRARLEIGWFYPQFPAGEFEIVGPEGIAVFDRLNRSVELRTTDGVERVNHDDDWWDTCFRIQLDKFIVGIRSEQPLVPGTREGIYSLTLTKQIESAIGGPKERPV